MKAVCSCVGEVRQFVRAKRPHFISWEKTPPCAIEKSGQKTKNKNDKANPGKKTKQKTAKDVNRNTILYRIVKRRYCNIRGIKVTSPRGMSHIRRTRKTLLSEPAFGGTEGGGRPLAIAPVRRTLPLPPLLPKDLRGQWPNDNKKIQTGSTPRPRSGCTVPYIVPHIYVCIYLFFLCLSTV